MFNIGPGELMAIAAVALIVLGPQRLPQAMRQVSKVVGELRRISGGFQDELRRAIDESDVGDEADDEPEYRAVAIEATTTDNAEPAAAAPADAPSADAPPADATVTAEDEDDEPEAMVLPSDPPELPTRPALPSRSSRRAEEPSANGDGPTGDERAVS